MDCSDSARGQGAPAAGFAARAVWITCWCPSAASSDDALEGPEAGSFEERWCFRHLFRSLAGVSCSEENGVKKMKF